MEELSRTSVRTAGQSQNVVASSEEQMASMQEIAASAATLHQVEDELNRQIGKFKLE